MVNIHESIPKVLLEGFMLHFAPTKSLYRRQRFAGLRLSVAKSLWLALLLLLPVAAHAQGSPFDTGFNAIQALFTGTIAKVASLVAIVIGGYGFAHGEPGAKKALAGVAAGTGIAVLAVNVLSWLWGV
jgi:type IV secretory pathway VirB2 component (pilin)